MEINITEFCNFANPFEYSASVAELGNYAGKITWNNAKAADFFLLDTEDKQNAMREWVKSSGGWNNEECAGFNINELNALFIQLISGDIREKGDDSWEDYEQQSNKGIVSGCLFKGIDDNIYYYLGN